MPSWRRLTFAFEKMQEEELAVILHERGTLGIESQGDRLDAYFRPGGDEPSLIAGVVTEAASAGGKVSLLRAEDFPDGAWHERWMSGLAPFEVGKRFLIVPGPDGQIATDARAIVRLTPGRAFGTGEHATTRLCLEMIEERVHPGIPLLDVGTGSGILAIAGRMLGADPVLAIDVDETSVFEAARNAAINGVAGIAFAVAGLEALRPMEAGLIVANLSAAALLRTMEAIGRLGSEGAILSGLLLDQEAEVRAAASRAGLVPSRRAARGEWVALSLERARP